MCFLQTQLQVLEWPSALQCRTVLALNAGRSTISNYGNAGSTENAIDQCRRWSKCASSYYAIFGIPGWLGNLFLIARK